MDLLAECGGDTDARDNNGCTALVRATMAKNIPLITHLLQLGVDIDAQDNDEWTPLYAAMIHNDESVIRLLLPYGSNVGKTDSHDNTALNQAAILGATLVVRHILAFNPYNSTSQSRMNLFGETSLSLACKHNNSPIVKILLKHGANPHHVDPNGNRALDRAMYWGSYACVRLLLEAGAGLDGRALLALQQGKFDNSADAGSHDMILIRLRSQYPTLVLPTATTTSQLRGLFARMREKQGKPPLDLDPAKDEKKDETVVSPDPFEACIPKAPSPQIINNNTTNIQANGNKALEIGAVVGTNLALNITSSVLGL
jgi:ankyrin repeat protein